MVAFHETGAALWVIDYVLQGALNGVERLYFHQGTIGNCVSLRLERFSTWHDSKLNKTLCTCLGLLLLGILVNLHALLRRRLCFRILWNRRRKGSHAR